MNPRKTPVYEEHKKLGGQLVDFAGFELPIQYKGIIPEHQAVRNTAGLFDVSHMGELEFTGEGALDALQWLTTNDVSKLVDGKAQYSILCNEEGTIVDDIIVYRFSKTRYIMVVNASNREKDFNWCKNHLKPDTILKDRSDEYALFALQGPKAQTILQQLTKTDLTQLKRFSFIISNIDDIENVIIARTGYTGEDGFEIFSASDDSAKIWQAIMKAGEKHGIEPIGLGARDTLRLEMKYSLYGNDISDETNPLEAGLAWVVKLNKGEFIGRDKLLTIQKDGIQRSSVGFEMVDKGIPRHGYPICLNGKKVGEVTSGTHSPTLGKSIGIGYVPFELNKVDTAIEIDIRGKLKKARIVKTPFVKK